MSDFETKNPADGTVLRGYIWACDKPKIAMSLIHGFGEHCGRYAGMAKYLNAQGIAVVALDLRGHGRSDGKRGVCKDYNLLSADVDALLAKTREAFPGLPHFIFGHSMGGGLVLHYGLNHSDDIAGFLVSAPLIRPAEPIPGPLQTVVKILRRIAPNGTLPNPIPGTKVSTVPAEQKIYEADTLNHGRLGFGLAAGMIEAGEEVLNKAGDWTEPLLLWHANGDQLTDFTASEGFAAKAQNCTFIAYEDCEHEMHNDSCRPKVYTMMAEFMQARIA